MKLELEFASPNSSVSHQFTGAAGAGGNDSADTSEMLQLGIKYAKEGNRLQARQLLSRVTDADPRNETAWLWMASISEYPEELLAFLQNVLNVNPTNERAVEWQKATKTLLAKTFVERGINASQENQKEFAKQCFMQALSHDDQNELAWLWLASNADAPEEKSSHLQKVLSINPENETALASLKSLKHETSQSLLKKANFAAISGERELARELLDETMQNAPELEEAWILKAYLSDDSQEKIACYEKILDLNPENEAAQAGLASLKVIMQKSVKKKSNAETLQEVLGAAGSSQEYISDVEEPDGFFAEIEEVEEEEEYLAEPITDNLDLFDAQPDESPSEVSPQKFTFDSKNIENFVPESSESPTDELDASFVEAVKSQGSFLDAEPTEWENFKQVSAENRQNDFEVFSEQSAESATTAGGEQDQNFGEMIQENDPFAQEEYPQPESSDESPFGNADETEQVLLSNVDEDFSQPEEEEEEDFHSYKTTLLEQSYLDKVKADSEAFASNQEVLSLGEAAAPTATQMETLDEDEIWLADDDMEEEEVDDDGPESDIHKTPLQGESLPCPFCYVLNAPQAYVCCSCQMILTLSDLEMLLSNSEAHPEVLEMAIEDLEGERASRKLNETELTNLGIAYLNAKNLRKGLDCLQEAAEMNPNDIVLASQVKFLAIRLSEVEEHESKMEATPPVKNLTIMVVDDSPTVRKLISGKLEKCGHTVVAAADGAEALAKITEVIPDLILLDIMMPQMDGYQVCKLIRNNEPTRNVPVIMISGKDGFFDKVRGRMAGTTGFISKPFGPETLMKTIETYVV